MRPGVRKVLVLGVFATTATTLAVPARSLAQDARKAAPAAARPQQPQQQQPAAVGNRPAQAPADPRMKKLLGEWEKKSATIKTLDVKILRHDKSPAWGDEDFEGRALLQSPNRAWLDFRKVEDDEKGGKKLVAFDRIICTGAEVWQYKPDTKQVFIFPLDNQSQKRALEEGPLPFLFNMKAAEAEARYEMALANEKQDAYVISVVPRLKMDRDAFSKAFINLPRATLFPDRIFLISPDGKSTKDFKLAEVKQNVAISPKNFAWTPPPAGWKIVRDPGGDDQAAPAGAAAPAPAVTKRQAPVAAPDALPPRRASIAPRRPPAN